MSRSSSKNKRPISDREKERRDKQSLIKKLRTMNANKPDAELSDYIRKLSS